MSVSLGGFCWWDFLCTTIVFSYHAPLHHFSKVLLNLAMKIFLFDVSTGGGVSPIPYNPLWAAITSPKKWFWHKIWMDPALKFCMGLCQCTKTHCRVYQQLTLSILPVIIELNWSLWWELLTLLHKHVAMKISL